MSISFPFLIFKIDLVLCPCGSDINHYLLCYGDCMSLHIFWQEMALYKSLRADEYPLLVFMPHCSWIVAYNRKQFTYWCQLWISVSLQRFESSEPLSNVFKANYFISPFTSLEYCCRTSSRVLLKLCYLSCRKIANGDLIFWTFTWVVFSIIMSKGLMQAGFLTTTEERPLIILPWSFSEKFDYPIWKSWFLK